MFPFFSKTCPPILMKLSIDHSHIQRSAYLCVIILDFGHFLPPVNRPHPQCHSHINPMRSPFCTHIKLSSLNSQQYFNNRQINASRILRLIDDIFICVVCKSKNKCKFWIWAKMLSFDVQNLILLPGLPKIAFSGFWLSSHFGLL